MTNGNLDKFDPNDEQDLNSIQLIIDSIREAIKKTNLDLTGLTVLTEAATGHWKFTPFIAAMANAASVICITKNSRYGDVEDIMKNFSSLIEYFGYSEKIQIFEKVNEEIIGKADIITNSGHVRPIDKKFIDSMKNTAVISLMWEPWEFRDADLDLSYCFKKEICVLGVNEDNDILNIMKYVEDLILEIFKINNLDLKDKKIIFVAENKSAHYMIPALKSLTNSLFCVSSSITSELKSWGANVIGKSLHDDSVRNCLENSDLVLINSHPIKEQIIGDTGISVDELKKLAPKAKVVVFFGNVAYEQLNKEGIECFPTTAPSSEHMEWNLDILNSKPTLELCTLGLKSVENLAKDRKSGLDVETSFNNSKENPFCLDFSKEQKERYFT